MSSVLMVGAQVPTPPRANGWTVRFNPLLRYLAERHEVDFLEVGDPRQHIDPMGEDAPAMGCRRVLAVPPKRLGRVRRGVRILRGRFSRWRAPWTDFDPWVKEPAAEVCRRLASGAYDAVLVMERPDLAGLVLATCRGTARCVLDWVDSPSLRFQRRAEVEGLAGTARAMRRCEDLRRWQRRINRAVDCAIYIADADARHAEDPTPPNVHVLPNGLLDEPPPELRGPRPRQRPPVLGFLGNMGYLPNIRGAIRAAEAILPRVREQVPEARLRIIGRNPDPEVLRLAGDGVDVTGAVESVWEALATCDVMLFPLSIGGGLQNKILESLAAGVPVVTTPGPAAGLGPGADRVLLVGRDDAEVAAATLRVLRDADLGRDLALRGIEFVTRFRWEDILPRYEALLLGNGSHGCP